MQTTRSSFAALSDHDLLAAVKQLAARERHATAHLIASLVELDARRLYLGEGCSSLFTYCTQILHLSEHAAYGRIEAARAARRFPVILELLAEGTITLTTVGVLAPHLTGENHQRLLAAAQHRSKREVEHQIAHLCPRPDVPASVRKLPAPTNRTRTSPPPTSETGSVLTNPAVLLPTQPLSSAASAQSPEDTESTAPSPAPVLVPRPQPRPAVIAPLAPERYRVQVTLGAETVEKLRRAQDLLRHTIPTGDPAAIFDRALTLLLDSLERTKLAATDSPRPGRPPAARSRHIPAAVRRGVWARDGGQCAFIGTEGRCAERGFLEFHHVVPYAVGGTATIETISLRCKRHNGYEAEQEFGLTWEGTRSGPSQERRHTRERGGDLRAASRLTTPDAATV
ncbi:MAG: hypothetical protein HY657_05010 [Acidobacteria bacterium]|nr:hypothetical protein [Acidobacteriota bacterium]